MGTRDEEFAALRARVTALTMLVEALWVEHLDNDADPKELARLMIEHVHKADQAAIDASGDEKYPLQVSEALTAIVDRALDRALSQRGLG